MDDEVVEASHSAEGAPHLLWPDTSLGKLSGGALGPLGPMLLVDVPEQHAQFERCLCRALYV